VLRHFSAGPYTREEIRLQCVPKGRSVQFGYRLVPGPSRVVYIEIETSEAADRSLNHANYLLLLPYVALDRLYLYAEFAERGDIDLIQIETRKGKMYALLGKRRGNSITDAGGSPCNQSNLPDKTRVHTLASFALVRPTASTLRNGLQQENRNP
jgi:hypothetical protein